MNNLISELQRLYFLDGQRWISSAGGEGALTSDVVAGCLADEQTVALKLAGADGMARALVVEFEKASDWQHVARLYQAVQDDLGWPAPALSVSGHQGYALWFSLALPVPVVQAGVLLAALRATYLADLPATRVGLRPVGASPAAVTLVPGRHPATGKWSTFIDPTLGGMFIDEPWLEMAPSRDKQADLLAALKSISAAEFQEGLAILQRAPQIDPTAAQSAEVLPDAAAGRGHRVRRSTLGVGNDYRDPQSFLLAVMNDASASARHRIAAAKALLPWFAKGAAEER